MWACIGTTTNMVTGAANTPGLESRESRIAWTAWKGTRWHEHWWALVSRVLRTDVGYHVLVFERGTRSRQLPHNHNRSALPTIFDPHVVTGKEFLPCNVITVTCFGSASIYWDGAGSCRPFRGAIVMP